MKNLLLTILTFTALNASQTMCDFYLNNMHRHVELAKYERKPRLKKVELDMAISSAIEAKFECPVSMRPKLEDWIKRLDKLRKAS